MCCSAICTVLLNGAIVPPMTTTPTQQETPTITFFAYGTLRKGQRLHNWIAGEIIEDLGTVQMPYARLHYASHRGFPFLVPSEHPSDVVTGELYRLPLNRQVISMLEMEQNAGYTIEELSVIFGEGEMPATVCVWNRDGYGDAVPLNDWVRATDGWWN